MIAEWKIIDGFHCRVCGQPARQNPDIRHSWGCSGCNGESCSLAANFVNTKFIAPSMTPHEAWLFRLFWPVMRRAAINYWTEEFAMLSARASQIALEDDARSRLFLKRLGEVFEEALDGSGEGG